MISLVLFLAFGQVFAEIPCLKIDYDEKLWGKMMRNEIIVQQFVSEIETIKDKWSDKQGINDDILESDRTKMRHDFDLLLEETRQKVDDMLANISNVIERKNLLLTLYCQLNLGLK